MNSRTCVGCRESCAPGPREAPHLLRLAWDGRSETVAFDEARCLPGRGCWIHPNERCGRAAMKRRAVPRALRRRVDPSQLAGLFTGLTARTEK